MRYEDLHDFQKAAIDYYIDHPPKYYKWFYKFYKKFLVPTIYALFAIALTLALVHNFTECDCFSYLKAVFFVLFGIGLTSAGFYVYKHLYTKRYAKKYAKMSIKEFNEAVKGLSFNM